MCIIKNLKNTHVAAKLNQFLVQHYNMLELCGRIHWQITHVSMVTMILKTTLYTDITVREQINVLILFSQINILQTL